MEGDEDEQMVDRSSGLASNVWSTKSDGPEESGGTVERKKFRHRNVDKGPYTMDRHEKRGIGADRVLALNVMDNLVVESTLYK